MWYPLGHKGFINKRRQNMKNKNQYTKRRSSVWKKVSMAVYLASFVTFALRTIDLIK